MEVDRWIEEHIDVVLDHYATLRRTEHADPRPPELIKKLMEPTVRQLVSSLRGESQWGGFIEELVTRVLAAKQATAASVSEAARVMYQAVQLAWRDAPEVPHEQWKLAVCEQMLLASEHVAFSLDMHLGARIRERNDALAAQERLQQEVIDAQQAAIRELSTPIIPLLDRIIVMPIVGSVDTRRARDILRALLAGIREHRAQVVILDVTGVAVIDTSVANHLTKAIGAARLKGARPIVTGLSDAAAETIVEMGIDWSGIETLSDLQTGLGLALSLVGFELRRREGVAEARDARLS
ncbi:STAS domain-containing protein [Sandaracinus amylolyticus]|uniref:STAS domain-containing protein n=1 Tax=Sandaracinus amylolyticus TaxID=927083 RepID=UPI00069D9BEB|nr:STAS domain-containing protein [Sandaracinus amylolyticus]